LKNDSEKVSKILKDIFAENEETASFNTVNTARNASNPLSLDFAHAQFLDTILSKEKWPRNEFELLAKEKKLLPDGAIETINEASYNMYDAPWLDDDDGEAISVDLEIAKMLAG
jgi:hypothetical protein